MHDWEKPHITREGGRYSFTRPVSKTIGEKIDVTEDMFGWLAQERERCIALLLATNPMDVSICDPIHGDQWIDDAVRCLFDPKP